MAPPRSSCMRSMRRGSVRKSGLEEMPELSAVAAVLEAALAMRDIGAVVTAGIVLEDLKRLTPVQPPALERRDQYSLDLGEGKRRSFFFSFSRSRSRNRSAKKTYSMCRCQPFQVRCS